MDGFFGAAFYGGLFLIYGTKTNPRWWSIWIARTLSMVGAVLLVLHLTTGLFANWPEFLFVLWGLVTLGVAVGEFHLLDRWVALIVIFAGLALFLLWALLAGVG